ncbi:GNAT family N-acetyltransferase [Priestia megaterium]|nr:GNAT family N-acetyltransferase [Priestia megaterium]
MVVIRPVAEADVERLASLMKEYIVDFYQRPEPPRKAIISYIERLLSHPSTGVQFVAEQDNKLVGFATLYITFSTLSLKETAILNDLYVSPLNRGNKVGEQLFQTCASYVNEHQLAGMTWETAHDNHVAQRLYEKLGGKQSEWLHYEL